MKKTILIAAVMFFAFSVAASAQALFTVGSTPTTTVTSCGTTEIAGDVVFSTVPSSLPVITGTLTINYGVPISSLSSIVVEVTENIPAAPATFNLTSGWSYTGSTLTITLPAGWVNGVMIRVRGVRVDVSGAPNLSNLLATVSSTVNSLTSGELSVVVISSISSAISATAVGTTSTINSVFGTVTGTPSAKVNEGYVNGFVQGIGIQFNFTALPSGLGFTFPTTVAYGTGGVFTLSNQDLASTATPKSSFVSTDGAFAVIYRLTTLSTAAPETTSESLTVTPTLVIGSPITPGDVNFTAQVVRFSPTSTTVPNFAAGGCVTGSAKVLSVIPANTVLLVPYATAGGLYDTGLAIANTSTDPGTAIASNAKKQDGTITFYFYPQTGTAFQYPAAGGTLNRGTGLTAGVLKSGGLYTVLLSELLSAAGQPAAFSGYIFANVNATGAHGQYFISDFKFFTNGALMLVVNPGARNATVESLMH